MSKPQIQLKNPGIYNREYFSGSATSIFIGNIWVEEITSIAYSVSQDRTPLYGYADTYFRAVSKGPVLVQGQFSINFKEAGYLWLILNHYQKMKGKPTPLHPHPFKSSSSMDKQNIERLINGEGTVFERQKVYKALAEQYGLEARKETVSDFIGTGASLGGYSSLARASGGIGKAENKFEDFENEVWELPQEELDNQNRRADDPNLNPFDIYVSFGDFAGDDKANHTIQKISDVHILSSAKQIMCNADPIQEVYAFLGRTLV